MECWRRFAQCAGNFAASLCGRPAGSSEREGLLNDEQIRLAPLEEGLQLQDSDRQYTLVMRHGERIDEVDDEWLERAERPWDPHLTEEGRIQAASSAAEVRDFNVDYIITSPFHRCLETSAQVLVGLGMNLDKLVVDCEMCEILNPRTMYFGGGMFPSGNPEGWMWNGAPVGEAVEEFIKSEPSLEGVSGHPTILDTHMPEHIESVMEAIKRYSAAIQRLSDLYWDSNILIVTHGEALRASIVKIAPELNVYETKHTSFTAASRKLIHCKNTGQQRKPWRRGRDSLQEWELITENGTTGVSWL